MSKKLAESEKYLIQSEFEAVYLVFKQSQRKVKIGDFYGDSDMAVISEDEQICVMCGCGIIIYYLNEPFQEYCYTSSESNQWVELGREQNNEIWFNNIKFISDTKVEVITENSQVIVIDV